MEMKVKVKKLEDIYETLESDGRSRRTGIYFASEMALYCGKEIEVYESYIYNKRYKGYIGEMWVWSEEWLELERAERGYRWSR